MGSQVTRGAAQGEALEAALGAAGVALGAYPLGLLRAGMSSILSPSLVLEWLGKAGMWWMRSESEGGSPPASEPAPPPQWTEDPESTSSSTVQEPSSFDPLLSWTGVSPWTLLFILCVVYWAMRRWFGRSTSLVTVNVYTLPSQALVQSKDWLRRSVPKKKVRTGSGGPFPVGGILGWMFLRRKKKLSSCAGKTSGCAPR